MQFVVLIFDIMDDDVVCVCEGSIVEVGGEWFCVLEMYLIGMGWMIFILR